MDVPWGVQNHAQDFGLESFQNFNVGGGSSAPELYTVGPDDQIIITVRQLRPSLMKWQVCNLQLLLGLASAVILESGVPYDSRPYFAVSNLRLPQHGQPGSQYSKQRGTRRAHLYSQALNFSQPFTVSHSILKV
jgi:hypothetical protein